MGWALARGFSTCPRRGTLAKSEAKRYVTWNDKEVGSEPVWARALQLALSSRAGVDSLDSLDVFWPLSVRSIGSTPGQWFRPSTPTTATRPTEGCNLGAHGWLALDVS